MHIVSSLLKKDLKDYEENKFLRKSQKTKSFV
jgi:hypothetical protein